MNWIYIGEYYHIANKEMPSDCKFGVTDDLTKREYSLNRTKSPINYRMVKAWRVPDNMKREDVEVLISIAFSEQKYDGCEWYNVELEEFYTKILTLFDHLRKMTNNSYFNFVEEDLKSKGIIQETFEEIIEKRSAWTNLEITIDDITISGIKAKDRFFNFIKWIVDNNKVDINNLSNDFSGILKKNLEDFAEYKRIQSNTIYGFYLDCHSGTIEKKNIIDRISDKYGLGVICNVVKPNQ